jgi:poly(hydroxyalkanoate) depolymerase family esterase
MRNISDTISRLAALRARGSAQRPAGAPSGRLSELPAIGSNPGQLAFRAYLPDTLATGAPLVVVLHGCTQDAAAYDHGSGWSKLADEQGFAVLFPEQQRANNPNLCFNWFLPGDVTRGSGEVLSIREMIEHLVADHGLDRSRVFITGLSAGGAMAASMLAAYPETFAGGAIIAGLPHGVARTVPEAFDRMRGHALPSVPDLQHLLVSASPHRGPWPTVSIWHGSADQTVAPSNMDAISAQWRGVHAVGDRPDAVTRTGRLTRQVWRDAGGMPVVETNLVAAMGHGTPLAGDDGLGRAGAYMLDVGVSSTGEIAQAWGIAGTEASREAVSRTIEIPDEAFLRPHPNGAGAGAPRERLDPEPAQPRHLPGAAGVKKTIEDALRAAGLLR